MTETRELRRRLAVARKKDRGVMVSQADVLELILLRTTITSMRLRLAKIEQSHWHIDDSERDNEGESVPD